MSTEVNRSIMNIKNNIIECAVQFDKNNNLIHSIDELSYECWYEYKDNLVYFKDSNGNKYHKEYIKIKE